MSIERMLIPIPRPQYPALPEAFISALAWRAFDAPVEVSPGKTVGLRFRSTKLSTAAQIEYRQTAPTNAAGFIGFGTRLEQAGVVSEAGGSVLASALIDSISGVRSTKGDSQAASPLTPSVALMQNIAGLMGAPRPPDVGEIIEVLFALGADGEVADGRTATSLWLEAAEHRLSVDPLLRAVDTAVTEQFLGGARQQRRGPFGPRREVPHGSMAQTPFAWFRDTWIALTSDAWVDALPARVWVDWATTVLRLAYGLGFMWESVWYETIAREIVSPQTSDLTWSAVRSLMPTTIPWRSSRRGSETRDVASLISRRSYRADQIRHAIEDWDGNDLSSGSSFEESGHAMRADMELVSRLANCLRSTDNQRSGKNLWEASVYSLQTRALSGPNADYYGLLRRSGRRYLNVDPGTEWIAVVASLACGSPGATVSVSRVLQDLGALGVRPELPDLIALLERAGLARGSADADQGVLVQAAF